MASQQRYGTATVGEKDTLEWRMYLTENGHPISPFHDIELYVGKPEDGIINMVTEIPRGTGAKLEVSRPDQLNPIKQDVKKGKLRFIPDRPEHYGMAPRTFENPGHVDPVTNAKGDSDPLDVCEVGSGESWTGHVRPVKVLGVWAMIDDGETDWKILTIAVDDPLADKINDVSDLETHMPGKLKQVFEYLRDYKIPAGSGPNQFAFDGACKGRDFALKVIAETHQQWSDLVKGKTDDYGISLSNLTLGDKQTVTEDAAKGLVGN